MGIINLFPLGVIGHLYYLEGRELMLPVSLGGNEVYEGQNGLKRMFRIKSNYAINSYIND